jgi:small basic protein
LQDIPWETIKPFLFWGVILAAFAYGGYKLGLGITITAAIIIFGGYSIVRDAWLKRRVLSSILLVAMGVIFVLASQFKIEDTLLTSDDWWYVLAIAAIGILVYIGQKKGITEIYQVFAYMFILERVMTNHNWLVDVIVGRWIPIISTLATTYVIRP